jgi:hypothetical protein
MLLSRDCGMRWVNRRERPSSLRHSLDEGYRFIAPVDGGFAPSGDRSQGGPGEEQIIFFLASLGMGSKTVIPMGNSKATIEGCAALGDARGLIHVAGAASANELCGGLNRMPQGVCVWFHIQTAIP